VEFRFKKIGTIRTSYKDTAPYQPIDNDKGIFKIVVYSKYKRALLRLSNFKYIYVIYYIHKLKKRRRMVINPSWTNRKDLDTKCDANYGWVQGIKDYEHLLLHIKGIPHEY